jgi:hygromycin-B 4-O-kinase
VEQFLHERLGEGVREVAPIGQGDWSQAFSFQQGDANLIARFGYHTEDFYKDQYAMRFHAKYLPVPRVLTIEKGLGRYFCLSERAYGEMLEGLEEPQMIRIVPTVFRMLDALRTADITATTGFGGWDARGENGNAPHETWQDYLLAVDDESERVHGWHQNMRDSFVDTSVYDQALAYLKSHLDYCPNSRHLLHNDLLHFNVLVKEQEIRAIVDWGNALYGDFLYELAAFTFYAPWYPAMASINWREEARAYYVKVGVDIPHFDERLRCYEAHLGLSGMAYNAFTQRWDHFADTEHRTLTQLHSKR